MGLINIYYETMFEMHPWPTNFKTMIDGPILKFTRIQNQQYVCERD